jgi:8-oxo-dGTP pyrophosphatase MutT (NUDIX family)
MTWLIVAVLVLVALVISAGAWAYRTANRLDRLHVRYDLSWQALDGALARRAVVARTVAIDGYGSSSEGGRLGALADAAERAPRPARENAENELSAALAMVDPASLPAGLIAELADAEARVVLARRFHNDAVRDTLALAERRLVRAFRLGGTATLPSYFEIVEQALAHGDMSLKGVKGVPNHRTSARVVLLDETGAVLLLCGSDPANPSFHDGAAPRWWFTVGGEVGSGERLAETAARELAEETGLRVAPADMIGPVWRRDEVFEFNGSLIDSEEFYLVHRTRRFEPSLVGRTDLERRYIHGARWCDANDIAGLTAAGEQVYPLQLGELLPAANRLADVSTDNEAAAGVPQPIR